MNRNNVIKPIKADVTNTSKKNNSSVLGTFTGKCCDSNVFNNNDMHLSREVFETLMASDEYKRAMQNRHYMGFCGHPDNSDCQDFEHACIVMTDMRLLDNGEVEGDFDLIDTPVGRIVKAFIDAGVNFGISIRGLGDVDANGEVDPDQFMHMMTAYLNLKKLQRLLILRRKLTTRKYVQLLTLIYRLSRAQKHLLSLKNSYQMIQKNTLRLIID